MHYVIIGGGGFLGAHLLAALHKNDVTMKCVVVDPFPKLHTFKTIHFNLDNVTYELGSFLDADVLDRVLPNAVTVFHLCAIGHTGIYGGNQYKQLVYDFNVIGTKKLIEKCKYYKVKRFIYSSSVAVNFVGKAFHNLTEDIPLPNPEDYIDTYSRTKAEAETFVLSESTDSFKTTCLRFRAIYGPQDVTVAEKVVRIVKNGWFQGRISRHGRESVSNMCAGENCGMALNLADCALQKTNCKHGQVYFIHDGCHIGQYSVWSPLIRALGRNPPMFSIPYQLVYSLTPLISWFCFEILNCEPPMTQFELAILANDNTYSIERAKKDLGYVPEQNLFAKTVEFYKKQVEISHEPFISTSDVYYIISPMGCPTSIQKLMRVMKTIFRTVFAASFFLFIGCEYMKYSRNLPFFPHKVGSNTSCVLIDIVFLNHSECGVANIIKQFLAHIAQNWTVLIVLCTLFVSLVVNMILFFRGLLLAVTLTKWDRCECKKNELLCVKTIALYFSIAIYLAGSFIDYVQEEMTDMPIIILVMVLHLLIDFISLFFDPIFGKSTIKILVPIDEHINYTAKNSCSHGILMSSEPPVPISMSILPTVQKEHHYASVRVAKEKPLFASNTVIGNINDTNDYAKVYSHHETAEQILEKAVLEMNQLCDQFLGQSEYATIDN